MAKLHSSEIILLDYHQETNFSTAITTMSQKDFLQLCKEQNWDVHTDDNGVVARCKSQLVGECYPTNHSSEYNFCSVFYSRPIAQIH